MRKIVVLVMVGFLVLGLAGFALAGTKKVQAKPFIFDPEDSGLVAAAWVTHQGLPDAGKSAHALMLQMSPAPIEPPAEGTEPTPAPAATLSKAGVVIKGVKGLTLTELGFDIKNDGVFIKGPRFEVHTDSGVFTFTMSASTSKTPINLDWTRVRFSDADAVPSAPAPAPEPAPAPTAVKVFGSLVVQSVMIIFDEEGSTLLDNIDFNGALMGKPGNATLNVAPQFNGKK
jgi:hypothetical protein